MEYLYCVFKLVTLSIIIFTDSQGQRDQRTNSRKIIVIILVQ